MTFEDADGIAGGGEFRLLLRPRGRAEFFLSNFGDGDGKVVVGKALGGEGGVVVVVTDITEKEGPGGSVGEAGLRLQREGAFGGPPGVEMAPGRAAEAGSAPAFVVALGNFVVEAFGVDEETLQQQRGAFADGLGTVGFKPGEKVRVAEEGVRRPGCLEGGGEEFHPHTVARGMSRGW